MRGELSGPLWLLVCVSDMQPGQTFAVVFVNVFVFVHVCLQPWRSWATSARQMTTVC